MLVKTPFSEATAS